MQNCNVTERSCCVIKHSSPLSIKYFTPRAFDLSKIEREDWVKLTFLLANHGLDRKILLHKTPATHYDLVAFKINCFVWKKISTSVVHSLSTFHSDCWNTLEKGNMSHRLTLQHQQLPGLLTSITWICHQALIAVLGGRRGEFKKQTLKMPFNKVFVLQAMRTILAIVVIVIVTMQS